MCKYVGSLPRLPFDVGPKIPVITLTTVCVVTQMIILFRLLYHSSLVSSAVEMPRGGKDRIQGLNMLECSPRSLWTVD